MQAMKSGIRQTTGEFANNFLVPPAMVAATVLGGAPLIGGAGRGASFLNTALQAPMQFGSRTIPGVTGYNFLGALGAGESINQFANPSSTTRQSIGRAIQDPTTGNILDASGNTLASGLGFVGIGAAKAMGPQLTRGAKQLAKPANAAQQSVPQNIQESLRNKKGEILIEGKPLESLLRKGKATPITKKEFETLEFLSGKPAKKLDIELGGYSQADQEKAFEEGTEFATKWAYDPAKLDDIKKEIDRLETIILNSPPNSPAEQQALIEINKLSQSQAFDQRFKDKVSDIFKMSNATEYDFVRFQKNKDYLINVDPNDPIFKTLPIADQQYVLDNYQNIGGARTANSTITLRKQPHSQEFYRVENKKPFDIKNPDTWFGIGPYGEPTLYELNYSVMQDPEIIRGVAAHEVGHDLQLYKNWIDLVRKYDPDYRYYTGHEDNPLAKRIKSALVDPVKPKGKEGYETETWLSGFGEVHSEIMGAREKLANSYVKRGYFSSLDEAIAHIRSRSDSDDFIDQLIEFGNLKKHFKPGTTQEEKRFIVKIAPALVPTVLGTGATAAVVGSDSKQPAPGFRYGGPISYQNGGPTDPPYTAQRSSTAVKEPVLQGQKPYETLVNPSLIGVKPKDQGEIKQSSPDALIGGPSLSEIVTYGPGQMPNYMKASGRNPGENYYEPLAENVTEFFDPTGILSHDDARASFDTWKKSGKSTPTFGESLNMVSALPAIGKFKILGRMAHQPKLFNFLQGSWNNFITTAGATKKLDNLTDLGETMQQFLEYINKKDSTQKAYGGGLRRWFKEDWTDVKTGEPCGRESASDSSRPYPYCRPANKVSSETPATIKHPEAKRRAKAKTGPSKVTPIKRR